MPRVTERDYEAIVVASHEVSNHAQAEETFAQGGRLTRREVEVLLAVEQGATAARSRIVSR